MCFVVRCCSLLGCLLLTAPAWAQEATQPPSPQDLLAQTRPGPEHERLAALEGDWRITITMGGGPQQAVWRGEAAAKSIVGRRFLEINYKAEGAGEPAEGVLLLGFDRRHGEYTLVALDQWGTYWVTARGKPTAGSPVIKMYGRDDDPMMKAMGLTKEFAFALDLSDAAKPRLAALMIDTRTPERKELKLVEYAFERASK